MDLNKWLNQVEDTAVQGLTEGNKNGLNEGFEDGTYVGVVTKHELKESSTGKPGILRLYTILESDDPALIGENYMVWDDLEREDAFKYLGWSLKALKVDISDPSEVIAEMRRNPEDLFDLAEKKTVVKFQLKTTTSKTSGKDYQNLNVKNIIEDYDFDAVPTPADNGGSEGEPEPEPDAPAMPDPQIGMKLKFNVEEGKGKNKQTVEKTGEITAIDMENEVLTVKTEDGVEHEVEGNQVTEILTETPVE